LKIRRALIGSTVLFAAGCWGSTDPKVGADLPMDDSTSSNDGSSTGDTNILTDAGLGMDASTCYERPSDPLTLVGSACTWPSHVECDADGRIVVQCLESQWTQKSFDSDGGEVCECGETTDDCKPPALFCEVMGVGFLGINVAGWNRQSVRTLRLV
jgi:hypothetical protein